MMAPLPQTIRLLHRYIFFIYHWNNNHDHQEEREEREERRNKEREEL
jgi:hypothetical protein